MSFGFSMRGRVTSLLVLACAVAPGTAAAQFGSLAKKVKDKVAAPSTSAPTTNAPVAGSNDCIKCAAKNIAITPDLISKLLTGLKAEIAERNREEKEHANDGVGRLYAARDFVYHCDTLKMKDSATQMSIMKRMQTGDQASYKDMQAFAATMSNPEHQKCASNRAPAETDQGFFNMMNVVQAHQDTVAAKASGMSVLDFEAAVEMVSLYVLAYDPKSIATHYPPSAISAMDAHHEELATLMKVEFVAGGQHKVSGQL
jgi:hypothetical protein